MMIIYDIMLQVAQDDNDTWLPTIYGMRYPTTITLSTGVCARLSGGIDTNQTRRKAMFTTHRQVDKQVNWYNRTTLSIRVDT